MTKWRWLQFFIMVALLAVAAGGFLPIAYSVARSSGAAPSRPGSAGPNATLGPGVVFLPVANRQFISSSPSPSPSPTAEPTATDPGETITPVPTSTPPPSEEVIVNGDFEQGHVAWIEQAGSGTIIHDHWRDPYEGSWIAWFGGYTNSLDILTQVVHIPTDTANTQTLTFYLYVESTDNPQVAYDFFYLRFLNMEGAPLSSDLLIADNTTAPLDWTFQQISLVGFSDLAGQDIQVQFEGTGDYSEITNFCIDIVSFNIVGGGEQIKSASPHLEIVR